MGRKNSIMSEQLKYEIARDLGVDHIVSQHGWGAVSSRDCGNIVKRAIERAEMNISSPK